ncbi:putative O-glycosylation ligase, exosortase A system-associated [Pseudothauera rhizosphaerae]|uniref:Putative O-glycosylation ligase, exosortase A system-associated n=2 Tax=Pseudothauera rhizosphaerae TaxID=2565932 RepID=A0A4S4APY1_9RHOO|nr:putative O-glycosylation ligase, exosortase A system-associated [Pseudothauera rhizosphaerae]
MRDLLLFLIVMPGGLIALRHPFVGAMLWTWISMMNPHRLAWGFMYDAPVAAYLGLCTLIGVLLTKEKRPSPFIGAPTVWLAILIGWMCLTTLFAFDPGASFGQLQKVLKIDLMVLITIMLLRTKREMMVFAWVIALSIAFYGVKGGIFTLVTGGGSRVWGPPGSYIFENNALAVALIMTVPLLRFLQTTLMEKWQKYAMTAGMVLCGVSILGSHSRGALLAVSGMLAVLWWRGRNKFMSGLVILGCGALALSMMPERWWERMETIAAPEDRSAQGRINAWMMAYNIARDNFLGGGFSIYNPGVYAAYAPDPTFIVSAHSIYFHMLGEHGFIGLTIYLLFWFSVWRCAGWLRKHGKAQPETMWCAHLGAMVQVSIVGFAIGGAFLSLAYFDLPYNVMALTVAARYWVQSRGWEREPAFEPNGRFMKIPLFFGDRLVPKRPGLGDGKGRHAGREAARAANPGVSG